MSSLTAKFKIPILLATDPVAQAPTIQAAAANRMDLLLGESGTVTATVAANTTDSKVINLARTYPGDNGAAVPGRVWVELTSTSFGFSSFYWWTGSWTGSATTITGFTLAYRFDTAQSGRVLRWHFMPYLA